MEFFSVGSAYGFAKFAQLNVKWKKRENDIRKQTMYTETPQRKRMREEAARIRKANMISSLDAKLKGGGELTPDELEYLKENSPELYKEAVEIIKERQAYKKALENCRTKEEVTRLNTNKINGALTVARAIGSNPNIPKLKRQEIMEKILKRVMGIQNEHMKFVTSPRYKELPSEQELIEEKKNKNKEKAAEGENAEAPVKLEVSFEDAMDELQKLLDGITEEKPENAEGTEGAENKNGAEGENGAKKSGGEAPKSRPAAKITVNTISAPAAPKPARAALSPAPAAPPAPAPAAKIYTSRGSVKASAPAQPRAKVSVKA